MAEQANIQKKDEQLKMTQTLNLTETQSYCEAWVESRTSSMDP